MITIIGEPGRPATQEEIDNFLNTKKWSEMTEKDILELKKSQCVKCEFLSKTHGDDSLSSKTCDYVLRNRHSRGCSPLDCVIYGAFKPQKKSKRKRGFML